MKDKFKLILLASISYTLFLLVFGTNRNLSTWLAGIVVTVCFSLVFHKLISMYLARLTARIEAEQPITWSVVMNDVQIGTVSDSQYAAMLRTAFFDGWLMLKQVLNLGRMALVFAEKLLIVVPVLVFWGVVALAVFSPESYTEVVQEFLKADPSLLRGFIWTIVVFTFVVFGGMFVITNYRFGFKNHYSAAIHRMLRQHCNTSADGDICLWRHTFTHLTE